MTRKRQTSHRKHATGEGRGPHRRRVITLAPDIGESHTKTNFQPFEKAIADIPSDERVETLSQLRKWAKNDKKRVRQQKLDRLGLPAGHREADKPRRCWLVIRQSYSLQLHAFGAIGPYRNWIRWKYRTRLVFPTAAAALKKLSKLHVMLRNSEAKELVPVF